eukprot:363455-Chlamydomonas_euryale.AAC.11
MTGPVWLRAGEHMGIAAAASTLALFLLTYEHDTRHCRGVAAPAGHPRKDHGAHRAITKRSTDSLVIFYCFSQQHCQHSPASTPQLHANPCQRVLPSPESTKGSHRVHVYSQSSRKSEPIKLDFSRVKLRLLRGRSGLGRSPRAPACSGGWPADMDTPRNRCGDSAGLLFAATAGAEAAAFCSPRNSLPIFATMSGDPGRYESGPEEDLEEPLLERAQSAQVASALPSPDGPAPPPVTEAPVATQGFKHRHPKRSTLRTVCPYILSAWAPDAERNARSGRFCGSDGAIFPGWAGCRSRNEASMRRSPSMRAGKTP